MGLFQTLVENLTYEEPGTVRNFFGILGSGLSQDV